MLDSGERPIDLVLTRSAVPQRVNDTVRFLLGLAWSHFSAGGHWAVALITVPRYLTLK